MQIGILSNTGDEQVILPDQPCFFHVGFHLTKQHDYKPHVCTYGLLFSTFISQKMPLRAELLLTNRLAHCVMATLIG
jgi:hypothetical protein